MNKSPAKIRVVWVPRQIWTSVIPEVEIGRPSSCRHAGSTKCLGIASETLGFLAYVGPEILYHTCFLFTRATPGDGVENRKSVQKFRRHPCGSLKPARGRPEIHGGASAPFRQRHPRKRAQRINRIGVKSWTNVGVGYEVLNSCTLCVFGVVVIVVIVVIVLLNCCHIVSLILILILILWIYLYYTSNFVDLDSMQIDVLDCGGLQKPPTPPTMYPNSKPVWMIILFEWRSYFIHF